MSERYTLYHFPSCPYCARVRDFLDEAGIDIDMRNIHADPQALHDLRTGGGSTTVPCLRIQRDGNRCNGCTSRSTSSSTCGEARRRLNEFGGSAAPNTRVAHASRVSIDLT